MAEATYQYSINDDLPAEVTRANIKTSWLKAKIELGPVMETPVSKINTNEDVLDITFESDLTPAEKTYLDGDTIDPAGGMLAVVDNLIESSSAQYDQSGYTYKERTDPYTVTSTDYETFLEIEKDFSNETWVRVGVALTWAYSHPGTRFSFKVDADDEAFLGGTIRPPSSSLSDKNADAMFRSKLISAGSHTFKLQFKSGKSGKAAKIHTCSLEVQVIGA